MYDLAVIGGGTSGIATAISAAKNDLSVIIIEKNSFLGGSMTGALVMPMMKNALKNGTELSNEFVKELMQELSKDGNAITFSDGNPGWFNPEMLKCKLDDLCEKYNIKVLFNSVVCDVKTENNQIKSCEILNAGNKFKIEAKYFVDATGNGDLANLANVDFENGNNGINQAMTLRFIMANIDLNKFAEFLKTIDNDENVSPVAKINDKIHLSTACTWDNKSWKLRPYFEKGVKEGILKEEDAAYFQIFTIPNQDGAVAFNAPRISAEKSLNPLNVQDTSYALIQGRKQIRRIAEFVKKYLPGFENAYISQIAPMLGVRDSRRIKCEYKLTEENICSAKKFENAVARSNYPIDVHSLEKNKSILKNINENEYFEIPLDSLKVKNYDNFFVVGKIIDATFLAQAALRIIPNCLSMGAKLGGYIAKKINK